MLCFCDCVFCFRVVSLVELLVGAIVVVAFVSVVVVVCGRVDLDAEDGPSPGPFSR